MAVEIRDIGTTVRQVVVGNAPASATPELMPVAIGIHRQVAVKEEAGEYANAAVDILLAGLLSTSDLDVSSVHAFVTNEFGEVEITRTTDITDLASFKVNSSLTATSFPAFLRYSRVSQAVHTTGSLDVDDSSNIQAPLASAVSTVSSLNIAITGSSLGSVAAGDVLELNDVNNSGVLRRFRITAGVNSTTVTLESKNPDAVGNLASGTHTNVRVFRPVYTLTDANAKFLDNRTRPIDDALASGSKTYPQPFDTLSNTATYTGLWAFAKYSPLVGSAATWRIKTWSSNTAVILDKVAASNGSGPQWAGPPLFDNVAVRYSVETQEPAVGRVPLATADVTQSYIALRNDLVGIPTVVQGAKEALATFGEPTVDNPLGLAMFEMATISPNQQVMGVAVASDDAEGHAIALDALTTTDQPYDLVPLTTDADVISIYHAHVTAMSDPEERKERTLTFSVPIPIRTVRTDLGDSITVTVAAGPPATLTIASATFQTSGVVPGDLVELYDTANSVLRQFLITFVVSETKVEISSRNPDSVGNLATGSHNAVKFVTANYTAAQQVNLLVATAESYQDRRLTLVLPDKVFLSPQGDELEVTGSFAAANISALYAINDVSKPLSQVEVPGITRISGSNSRFTNVQLRQLTSAGILVLTQASPLVSPVIRNEVTTDVSNKKVQARSFTRIVDALSKELRSTLNKITGRERMTDEFLHKANVAISSVMEKYVRLKRINSYQIVDFGISEDDATALAVVITVDIPNVGNNIDITLVV